MVTSLSEKESIIEMIKKGVAAYIVKPYDKNDFLQIVRNILTTLTKKK